MLWSNRRLVPLLANLEGEASRRSYAPTLAARFLDEPLATADAEVQVSGPPFVFVSIFLTKISTSALGISHSLGHKLGARYKIPHGITSVGRPRTVFQYGHTERLQRTQCMTLSPAVLLKADIGSDNDKKVLANALFHLRETSTGSLDDDVRKLSSLIQK